MENEHFLSTLFPNVQYQEYFEEKYGLYLQFFVVTLLLLSGQFVSFKVLAEMLSEPCQTSKMELFAELVNN